MIKILEKKISSIIRKTLMDWPMDFGLETSVMNNVIGDYHEFGVYQGRSFAKNINSYRKLAAPEIFETMNFWAYDSFEGLPETNDKYAPAHFTKGAYSAPRRLFESAVEKAGLPQNQLKVIPGFYDQTLTDDLASDAFSQRKIAMTYIDCDIYESIVPVFDYITHGLQVGSIIVIDDWIRHHAHPRHGIQRAYNEWLEKNPAIKMMPLALSKRIAFIVYEV